MPGVLLFIFGGMFSKDLAILTGSPGGEQLGKVATGITYLFGAMACYIGAVGFAVGCCYTKCNKLSKVCACIVSTCLVVPNCSSNLNIIDKKRNSNLVQNYI